MVSIGGVNLTRMTMSVYRTLAEQHVVVSQFSQFRPDLIDIRCGGCGWTQQIDAENWRRLYHRRRRFGRPERRPLPEQALRLARFTARDLAQTHAASCRGMYRPGR